MDSGFLLAPTGRETKRGREEFLDFDHGQNQEEERKLSGLSMVHPKSEEERVAEKQGKRRKTERDTREGEVRELGDCSPQFIRAWMVGIAWEESWSQAENIYLDSK
jgi:hypothetical protein